MKSILILSLALLLTGCGEKFDTSSNSMTKISYNNILKDIEPQDRETFARRYEFYTKPYREVMCGEEGEVDVCIMQNDIESLHGLSYKEVIRTVEQHEIDVHKREAWIAEKRLKNYHLSFLQSMNSIDQQKKDMKVSMKSGYRGHNVVLWYSFKNESPGKIAEYSLCLEITEKSTGIQEIDECISLTPLSPIAVGQEYLRYTLEGMSLAKAVDDPKYSVEMSVLFPIGPDGGYLYPTMSTENYEEYVALKNQYPEEFSKIVKEFGE